MEDAVFEGNPEGSKVSNILILNKDKTQKFFKNWWPTFLVLGAILHSINQIKMIVGDRTIASESAEISEIKYDVQKLTTGQSEIKESLAYQKAQVDLLVQGFKKGGEK